MLHEKASLRVNITGTIFTNTVSGSPSSFSLKWGQIELWGDGRGNSS